MVASLPSQEEVGERFFQYPAADPRQLPVRLVRPGPSRDPASSASRGLRFDPTGNLKPAKDKSTARIDSSVALIMAIGRAMVVQEEPQPEYSLFFV